ncbi:nutritionally-regulated adipose and cardiac enriched protein homolog isoform X3 [Scleropages formosus]|uniref:nutritionally-regulated adipose and cardiac enriched protein homolog isoform X3 n=1 Tax=Scleropages formosus TaxID=113540 RepID=UPI00087892A2|nr:nutritionally-regulated adipose and cardiac enriched protein homolog isoform X3 [Scleropages formosus]
MLSGGREGLYELGSRLQQQGESRAALRCFLSCLLGLPHVHSFRSLPDCLHQIAELFIEEKNYVKALRFIQAEKMFYEVALIELTALQGNAGAQEASPPGSPGWDSPEEPLELSELASQAQDYERLAQLCIMSKRPLKFGRRLSATTTPSPPGAWSCSPPSMPRSARPSTQVSTCKFPTSILKRSNLSGSDTEPTQRRKSERRVRFREPENVVHDIPQCDCLIDYDGSPCRPHLALFACFFLLLSVLGVALYCTDRRRPLRMCEELEALLAVYLLQMKQVVWACWIWLTMQ